MNLVIAFVTGLTTGGLSCLAVQGGLLASSLARQLEMDMASLKPSQKFRPQIALPITLFLAAKLLAYTLLGVLLGALGSALQLTPLTRAILTIAIGIFMLGNGLRMLNVHPIFRHFIFEPPSALTRFMRRQSKNNASFAAPLLLGAMTVLIPCGVAQAMMAVALGTGNPVQGAAIMFAFTLGTTPVFFTVAYFATRLGATMEKNFSRVAAIIVLVLGLVAVDSGLNLAGSPLSVSKFVSNLTTPAAISTPAAQPVENGQDGYVVSVGDTGYSPSVLHLPAERPITLNWVTTGTKSCARSLVIPGLNYEKLLPSVGQIAFNIPAQKKGTTIEYSCSMGMYFGKLVFDQN
jgi:sulfite exporter TauE/SafE